MCVKLPFYKIWFLTMVNPSVHVDLRIQRPEKFPMQNQHQGPPPFVSPAADGSGGTLIIPEIELGWTSGRQAGATPRLSAAAFEENKVKIPPDPSFAYDFNSESLYETHFPYGHEGMVENC
jgi:hypothetical protein